MTLQRPRRALKRAGDSLARVLDLHSKPRASDLIKVKSFRFAAVLQGILLASAAFFTLGAALLATDVDAAAVCAAPGRDIIPTSGVDQFLLGWRERHQWRHQCHHRAWQSAHRHFQYTVWRDCCGDHRHLGGRPADRDADAGPDRRQLRICDGSLSGWTEHQWFDHGARCRQQRRRWCNSYTQSYSAGSNLSGDSCAADTQFASLGNYTAAAWDVDASGYGTGGVFAVDVAQQATLNGTVNVVGQGFRGGAGFNLAGNDAVPSIHRPLLTRRAARPVAPKPKVPLVRQAMCSTVTPPPSSSTVRRA